MKKKKLWVVKAGSQMVLSGGPLLLRHWMEQVYELRKRNIQIVWVTSGAIASAARKLGYSKSKKTLPEKQALSAIGQPLVMDLYLLALQAFELTGAQVLLTADDIKNKERRENLHNTLSQLLKWEKVPILNENDAVATAEIQFGDNDALASRVAEMMGAEKLILLTDVDGLYDKDPKSEPNAKLIDKLENINSKQLGKVKATGKSKVGTGGMYSKLLAAKHAAQFGISTHLVRGDLPRNLLTIEADVAIGTRILGKSKKRGRKS